VLMVSAYMFIRNKNAGEYMFFFTLCNTNFLGIYDDFYKFLYVFLLLALRKYQMKHCFAGVFRVSSEFST